MLCRLPLLSQMQNVLQKFEDTDMSIFADDDQNGKTEIKTTFHPTSHYVSSAPYNDDDVQTPMQERTVPAPNTERAGEPVLESLCQAISQQVNVTEYLVKNHKASLLPDISIPTFNGDPLEYNSFIGSIEHGIENRTDNNRDHLQYLLQYTSGQPMSWLKVASTCNLQWVIQRQNKCSKSFLEMTLR